ncbi:uncharacterized protein JCM6883_002663 [Sporobolomyces salmoneus]|uniref:uncharacterized protein n=1 Tax=Sporobolomyces salmoneus TaxID=183962 RepID=UPI00317C48A8
MTATSRTAKRSREAPSQGKSIAELRREKEVKRIKIAMAVTSIYMLVELVVGYSFSALVLVADAFHMLNDLVAFIVRLYADEIGGLQRQDSKDDSGFTYGFSRVAFVANLINGVILVALCLMLGLESIQRLYSPEPMELPPLVAGLGLLACGWNWIMWLMFRNASHGDGNGDHEMHSHSVCHPVLFRREMIQFNNVAVVLDGLISLAFGPRIGRVSGIWKPWKGVGYVDPLASLVVVYLILRHSFPLVTASSYALMQAFDPQRTKRFRQIFQSTQEWLPASLCERLHLTLVELRIWSLSKEDHIATIKLKVAPVNTGERLVIGLDDLSVIEQAARKVLKRANIREEMM